MFIFAVDDADSTAVGTRTVEGLVRDIACPLQNKKSTSTSYSKDCIAMCAKAGSPMGILTGDGSVYVPVTESMPDTGQDALKPFIGKHVQATGKVFERNGTHAIEISEIHELPGDQRASRAWSHSKGTTEIPYAKRSRCSNVCVGSEALSCWLSSEDSLSLKAATYALTASHLEMDGGAVSMGGIMPSPTR